MRLSTFIQCITYVIVDEIVCLSSVRLVELCDIAEGFALQHLIGMMIEKPLFSSSVMYHMSRVALKSNFLFVPCRCIVF